MDIWLTLRLVRDEAQMLVGPRQTCWRLYAGPATPDPDDQVYLGTFDAKGEWLDSPPDPPTFD